jgi:hypothetical protein
MSSNRGSALPPRLKGEASVVTYLRGEAAAVKAIARPRTQGCERADCRFHTFRRERQMQPVGERKFFRNRRQTGRLIPITAIMIVCGIFGADPCRRARIKHHRTQIPPRSTSRTQVSIRTAMAAIVGAIMRMCHLPTVNRSTYFAYYTTVANV